MNPSYYSSQNSNNFRRYLYIVISLVVVVFVLVEVFNYLSTGKIVVTSSDPGATITVSSSKEIKSSVGTLSARLHSGQYIVTANNNTSSSARSVTIKARSTTSYSLQLKSPKGVEPVASVTASSIAASGSRVLFINGLGYLTLIDSANNTSTINGSLAFTFIDWANTGFGVGETPNGDLYTVTNGSIAKLPGVPTHSSRNHAVVAVNPAGQIYLAFGNDVFLGSSAGGFNRIYYAGGEVSQLAAGPGEVAVLVTPDNNGSASKSLKPSTTIIKSGGQVVQSSIGGFSAAFSPDGKLLALSGDTNQILNSSLKQVAVIPAQNLTNPVWKSNDTLYYAYSDEIWEYDLSQNFSRLIAKTVRGSATTELSLSDDSQYLYLGANLSNNSPSIFRVGVAGQTVAPVISKLQSILPLAQDGYSLTLTNFTSPTIIVSPLPPLTDSDAGYANAAIQKLQSLGVDTSGVSIRVSD